MSAWTRPKSISASSAPPPSDNNPRTSFTTCAHTAFQRLGQSTQERTRHPARRGTQETDWEYKGSTGPQLDAIAHYGASLGNVRTYLNTGLTLRIGSLVPNDFGTSPIRPGGDSNAPLESNVTHRFSEGGLHAFISADARVVARDIFLDGNTFTDSPASKKGASLAT